jgi:hypothetical protein
MELASARFRRLGHHPVLHVLTYELIAMKEGYERKPSRRKCCVRDSAVPLLDNPLRLNRGVSPRKRRRITSALAHGHDTACPRIDWPTARSHV